ncbi:hypothetical protein [Streptomyces sp. NPDC059649]|uniref:hypothetical protein n=1 Tax=Streptomyces sp. NPDC059649 TaxID=3346895 RepID=UPI0036A61B35
MASIMLVAPANDDDAQVLASWASLVGDEAGEMHVILPGATPLAPSNRQELETYIETQNPDALFFFGHGTWHSLRGNDESLIDSDNADLLTGKMVIAMACKSALALGRSVVRPVIGVKSYIGFTDDLRWTYPEETLFGSSMVEGLRSMLEGQPSGVTEQALKDEFLKLAHHLKYERPIFPNMALAYLDAFWDAGHVKLHGDTVAGLS